MRPTSPRRLVRTTAVRFYRAALAAILLLPQLGADSRPNFLIFLADDLGYGDLGCYGHPFIRTPNLDRLAAEGIRFSACYAGSSICSPSRAALLTGRTPFRAGMYKLASGDRHLRREEVTISTLLKRSGYQTFFSGKWHLSALDGSQPNPGDHGFDRWFATRANTSDSTLNPADFVRDGDAVGPSNGYYCDLIVDETIAWLQKRDAKRPFFAYVCSSEPHTPVTPPREYAAMYETEVVEAAAMSIAYGGVDRPTKGVDISHLKKHYYGTITQLDAAIGRLLRALDELGLRDNTLVLFTSDNGPEHPGGETRHDPRRDRCFGTPGALRGMKRYLYEGGIRVPGLLRFPRRARAGQVIDTPVCATDILPTFCDLARTPMPTDRVIDGTTLTPLFDARPLQRQVPLCWLISYAHIPQMALRVGDEVVIAYFSERDAGQSEMDWIKSARLERFELYDTANDPLQKNDLAAFKRGRLAQLSRRMEALWRSIQVEGPYWSGWKRIPKPPLPLWWKRESQSRRPALEPANSR